MAAAFDLDVWSKRSVYFFGFRQKNVRSKIKGKVWDSPEHIPFDAIVVGRHIGTLAEAYAILNEIRAQIEKGPRHVEIERLPPAPKPVGRVGTVVQHSDGGRVHSAFCLKEEDGMCSLVFLTSSPHWNKFARPITRDEAALSGFPFNDHTYLAPVLRPAVEVSLGRVQLPEHRVEALYSEFFSDPKLVWPF